MTAQRERRSISEPVRLETREDSRPVIQGYAALFDVETVIYGMFRESIAPGAFRRSIQTGERVVSLFNHDSNYVLGSTSSGTMKVREDEKGLWIEVEPPDTQVGRDVTEYIRRGDVQGQSFMFSIDKQEWTFAQDEREMDLRRITEVTLFEAGPVLFPAYPDTSVGLRSNAEEAYKLARAEWERRGQKDEPVIIEALAPSFEVGSRVKVKGTPHMEGQATGLVSIVTSEPTYGIVFDGMEGMGVHKWYVQSELEESAEPEAGDEGDMGGMDGGRSARVVAVRSPEPYLLKVRCLRAAS